MNADTTTPPAVAVTEPWFLDPAIAGRTVIYAEPDGGATVVVEAGAPRRYLVSHLHVDRGRDAQGRLPL